MVMPYVTYSTYNTFVDDELEKEFYGNQHDKFVKKEVFDLVYSMMEVLKPTSEIIRSGYNEDLRHFIDNKELEKVGTIDVDRSQEELIEAFKKRMESKAKSLGFNVSRDALVEGATLKHGVDLILEKTGRRCIVIFRYLYQPSPLSEVGVREWIVPAVDIKHDYKQKIIFVFSGNTDYIVLPVVQHYYDAVIQFDDFEDYLRDELII